MPIHSEEAARMLEQMREAMADEARLGEGAEELHRLHDQEQAAAQVENMLRDPARPDPKPQRGSMQSIRDRLTAATQEALLAEVPMGVVTSTDVRISTDGEITVTVSIRTSNRNTPW